MRICREILVPSSILSLWQLTGLLPEPIQADCECQAYRTKKWLLSTWTLLILLTYGYFYAIEVIVFTRTYKPDLDELEFFTMILLLYREYFFVMPLIVLLCMLARSRPISTLVISVETALATVLQDSQTRIVRLYNYASWCFLLAVAGGSACCSSFGFQSMLTQLTQAFSDILGWSGMQPVSIVPGGAVSYGTMALIYGLGFAYATLCWSAPPLLVVGLVLAIGMAFSNLQKNLKKMSKESQTKAVIFSEFCQRMARIRDNHRRLRGAVATVNTLVAWMIILSTLGDIIMPISLISRILQSDSGNLMITLQNEGLKYGVYFFSVCAIVQGIFRISIFVWMHEEAAKAKIHLHNIGLHGIDPILRDAARQFEQEIAENPEELAISGNGFFSVTRNFAATLFGIILTYFLVIYQQKDQKEDLNKLSLQQQTAFKSLAALIEGLTKRLVKNSTEFPARN